jgi:DNA mismatch repair protein MutL
VDPNVHPSKHEVRLTRDREVTGMVYRAVSTKLMESREATARPLASIEPVGGETMALPLQPPATVDGPPEAPVQEMDRPALRVFGQSNRTFIIAEGPNGIYMIDQHAAHERILFDRFDEASAAGDAPVQSLLEPASVQLSPGQMQALDDNAGLLSSMGLLLEPFGSDSVLVRGVPTISAGTSPVELVLEVLSELETLPRAESPRERALAALACKAAVKAGMALDLQEMRELVMQLERTQRPATCPHGRPTMIHLSHMQLEREFGRR